MSLDPESRPLPKDSDWLSPFLARLRSGGVRLLELGCGPGLDAATLLAAGFEVTAFDRIPLTRARQNAPGARLLRADFGPALPFRDGAFDAAVLPRFRVPMEYTANPGPAVAHKVRSYRADLPIQGQIAALHRHQSLTHPAPSRKVGGTAPGTPIAPPRQDRRAVAPATDGSASAPPAL